MRAALEAGVRVVLDMTGLWFFSSAGLTVLLQLQEGAPEKSAGRSFGRRPASGHPPHELAKLTRLFSIYPSVAAALSASTS